MTRLVASEPNVVPVIAERRYEVSVLSLYEMYSRVPSGVMSVPPQDARHPLVEQLKGWIRTDGFPCVGAKSALSRGQLSAVVLHDIRNGDGDGRLHAALLAFVARARANTALFQSFAAIFEQPQGLSETDFETSLWRRIQSISNRDLDIGHRWDGRVSADPANPHFSLSFGGEAFFVVGLHPQASRLARRFRTPVLIFNMHAQFERLRTEGRYEKLRATILERDYQMAGSTNPMLQRFGDASEARQYSGRSVSADWRCPFAHVGRRNHMDGSR